MRVRWSVVVPVLMSIALLLLTAVGVASAQQSRVYVNDVRVTDRQVAALSRAYQVRVLDGSYWYDPYCGAWGANGGPAAGFISPGLSLGGPLRRDASNGETGVLVNGRELHVVDVLRLQQALGPIYRGAYWLDAHGNYGRVGGPMLGNLRAAGQASGRRREGILSTYDKTGAVVIGGQ